VDARARVHRRASWRASPTHPPTVGPAAALRRFRPPAPTQAEYCTVPSGSTLSARSASAAHAAGVPSSPAHSGCRCDRPCRRCAALRCAALRKAYPPPACGLKFRAEVSILPAPLRLPTASPGRGWSARQASAALRQVLRSVLTRLRAAGLRSAQRAARRVRTAVRRATRDGDEVRPWQQNARLLP
jgi:hypothetical protein